MVAVPAVVVVALVGGGAARGVRALVVLAGRVVAGLGGDVAGVDVGHGCRLGAPHTLRG